MDQQAIDRARFIKVNAEVRYWEDGRLNGQEDEDGKMPLRFGDCWCPVIDLETGRVIDWPAGNTADIYYKVCDAGTYWLRDEAGKTIAEMDGYVPDDILCVGDRGYGDYIILKIGADGLIEGWKRPKLDADEWEAVAEAAPAVDAAAQAAELERLRTFVRKVADDGDGLLASIASHETAAGRAAYVMKLRNEALDALEFAE